MNVQTDLFRHFDRACADACEWLGLDSRQAFFDLAETWPEHRDRLWAEHGAEGFYTAWRDEAGRANLCTNVIDQFARMPVWLRLWGVFEQLGTVPAFLDYGCGVGATSYAFADRCQAAILVDLPNLGQDWLRWRVRRDQRRNVIVACPEEVAHTAREQFDFIVCVDVLEHLPDPSRIFERLDGWLRPSGLYLHRAPWHREGEDLCEHLPEAPLDWHRPGGGADRLARGYELGAPIEDGGLYRKHR